MSERISVVVPVLEAKKSLKGCLDSLRRQTCGDLEIILADGSGQGQKYAGSDGRVRIVSGTYGSLTEAALAGAAAAEGELIGFADVGNRIDSDMFEKLRAVLEEKNADIAVCRNRIVPQLTFGAAKDKDGDGNDEPVNPFPRWDKKISGRKAVYDMLVSQSIEGVMWDKLFRRALLQGAELPGESDSVLRDERLLVDIFRRAGVIVCLREPLYERRLADGPGAFQERAEAVRRWQCRSAMLKETVPEFAAGIRSQYGESLEALVLKALETDWSEAGKYRELLTAELWPFYRDEGSAAVGDLSWQKRTKYRILLQSPALFWKLWPAVRKIKSSILH